MHDIKLVPPSFPAPLSPAFLVLCWVAKHFHKRKVSSAAADATYWPSGDMVMWRTRDVCPVISVTRDMAGYFQMVSWCWENPWPDINSLYSFDHSSPQTCRREWGIVNSCYWSLQRFDIQTRLKGQSALCLPMRWPFYLVRIPSLQKNILSQAQLR